MVNIHESAYTSVICLFTDIFLTYVITQLSEAVPPPPCYCVVLPVSWNDMKLNKVQMYSVRHMTGAQIKQSSLPFPPLSPRGPRLAVGSS